MDDIKFRDQCALEIFKELLSRESTILDSMIDEELNNDSYNDYNSSYKDDSLKQLDKLCDLSYKIADSMRKSRLKVFE